jgi:two-component system LytT family sensor kinase
MHPADGGRTLSGVHTTSARLPDATPRISRYWLLISAACLVPAVLDALQTYIKQLGNRNGISWGDVMFSGSEWLFLGALTPIAYYLARHVPLRRDTIGKTLLVHAGGALLLCVGWAGAGVALRYALGLQWDTTLGKQLTSWVLTSLPWSVFMYFTVLGCVYAFMYFSEAREQEAQATRLSAQLAEARLGALRMQLNPHFLFNSLNAIGVLVRDQNTAAASRMIELLGDMLHSVLRTDVRHEIPLAEEMQFLEQFLAIEQVRFSDRLRVHWSIDDAMRIALVPGFILQPLVENALRHGISKRSDVGTIEISAHRDGDVLVLRVRDDGPGLPARSDMERGVGLANIRERLHTLHGADASLSLESSPGGGTIATVRLPFRVPHHG